MTNSLYNESLIYSIIVPIYNDGYQAHDFCAEFENVFKAYLNKKDISSEVELIFVNDGSPNNSFEYLSKLASDYPFVKAIDLSRNFGQHIALSCGYANAKGDYIGMLNVDMQDPPDQLPLLIDHIKKNDFDIVFGLREVRYSSKIDKWSSLFFNIVLNKLTGSNTPLNVSTIRIMNRKFLNAYNLLTEKSRYLPGLEFWLGFRHGYLKTNYQERKVGKSSYTFKKRMFMAFSAITSFSDLPLKIAAAVGFFISIVGFILITILIIQKIFFINFQPGYSSLLSVIVFLSGIQIMFIGLASIYIGRIYRETQNRPLYVVKNTCNLKEYV